MTEYQVVEIYFKENSGEIEAVINQEAKDGWEFASPSTYSTLNDWGRKAHAVIVFSKEG